MNDYWKAIDNLVARGWSFSLEKWPDNEIAPPYRGMWHAMFTSKANHDTGHLSGNTPEEAIATALEAARKLMRTDS